MQASNEGFAISRVYPGDLNALVKNLMKAMSITDPNEAVRRVNSGEWALTQVAPSVITELLPEPVLDFIVRVDRSVKLTYPDWVNKVMHPELELAGPAEYDLSKVDQWLHDDQKRGSVVGNTIYKHLQKGDALATCLNLQDGLAIQAKGITVFRKLFAGKAVFLWSSIVRSSYGSLSVPYLIEFEGKVVLYWYWTDRDWFSRNPALRFA